MLNPKILGRMAQQYYADNNLCPKCRGSLDSCHEEEKEVQDEKA